MNFRFILAALILAATIPAAASAMPDMRPPAETAPDKAPISGKVVEVVNAASYTYLLIENADGFKDWVAVPELYVEAGEVVELLPGTQMGDWPSKSLNRTFKNLLMSEGPTQKYNEARKMNAHKKADMNAPAPGSKKSSGKVVEGLKVEKAKGENAYDLGEVIAKREQLQDKIITVRGQVVKITTGVMNRNWVHIKDGTGENGSNKLVITTKDSPETGEVVTFRGAFHNNVDFGGGYQYAIILEDAVAIK